MTGTTDARKPKLAVWKFASCDGCQLTVLNCEDELLALAGEVEIAYFPEATRAVVEGPYDLSLVEGSVTTADDAARIQQVRLSSRRLVTIGACATAGGIQALRNFADVAEFRAAVYAQPEYVETLATSTPISAHVSSCAAVRSTARSCSRSSRLFCRVASHESPGRASAWSANDGATSVSWSPTERRAWVRSPMPGAVPSVRRTTAAATGASVPRTPRTPGR